jgi:Domain of unknown function (DUF222)
MEIGAHGVIATPEAIVETDRLGEEIAELSAHLEAATAQLLDLIREFDARGGWNHGFRSCAGWLSPRVGVDPGAARERVRVARALGSLPRIAKALARGELSYAKVQGCTSARTRCARAGWVSPSMWDMQSPSCIHTLSSLRSSPSRARAAAQPTRARDAYEGPRAFKSRSSWLAKAWRSVALKAAGPPTFSPPPRSACMRLRTARCSPTLFSV